MFEVGRLVVSLLGDSSKLDKTIRETETKAKGLEGKTKKLGTSMAKSGAALSMGLTVPIAAAGTSMFLLSSKAADFENQMNEVFTLLPDISEKGMSDMTQQVKDFSSEMGVIPTEVVPALYQSLSAGVPPDNVFDFLEVANKAAVGGVTDLTTAVDGISSVVNAYGDDVIGAAQTSDLMFTAVKLGKTNFEELSGSLYNVIPTAAGLGVEFGNVTASLAALTAQGTPTSVATTQIRQMLVEMSKEGGSTSEAFKQIAGVGFKEFISQGHNVQDALKLMEVAAQEGGVGINDLFSSVEAGNAALGLTGKGTDKFTEAMAAMDNSAGAAGKAYERMAGDSTQSMKEIKAELDLLMLDIGQEFLPILKDDILPIVKDTVVPLLKDVVIPLISGASSLFKEQSPLIRKVILAVIAFAAAIGPLLLVLSPLVSALGSVLGMIGGGGVAGVAGGGIIAAMTGFIAAASPVIIPILAIVAAIVGLIAIGKLLMDHWDEITEFFGNTWDTILGGATALWDGFMEIFSWTPLGIITGHWDEITGFLGSTWDNLSQGAGDFTDGLGKTFEDGFSTVGDMADGFKAGMQDTANSMVDGLFSIYDPFISLLPEEFQDMFGDVKDMLHSFISGDIKGGIDKAKGLVTGFTSSVKSVFSGLRSFITSTWSGIVNTVKAVFNQLISPFNRMISALNNIRVDIPDWVPILGGQTWGLNIPNIPYLADGGVVQKSGMAVVGEAGPELVNLPNGAQVTPLPENQSFKGMFEGAVFNIDSQERVQQLAIELAKQIKRKSRARGTV
jgi:TP901 family phage tail tape measure protein